MAALGDQADRPGLIGMADSQDDGSSSSKGEVVVVQKQPPAESAQALRMRTRVVLAFWIIALLVGVPLWWVTTSIYRAPLPLQEMQNWSEGKSCRVEFPLLIDVEAPSIEDPQALLKLVENTLHTTKDAATHRPHRMRLKLSQKPEVSTKKKSSNENSESAACVLRLVPSEDSSMKYDVEAASRTVEIRYPSSLPSSSFSNTGGFAQFVAETLEQIFWQEQRLIEHLLLPYSGVAPKGAISESVASGNDAQTGRSDLQSQESQNQGQLIMDDQDIAKRMSRVVKYAPRYHLTFSLFTATTVPVSWDIETALKSHMMPLLNALSSISKFSISSQVQYYASLTSSIVPIWDEGQQSFTLRKEDLSSFINSAEWPLASMSDDPTINFILYVPHPNFSPLIIPSATQDNAFLLPQWGGIMILNPSNSSLTHHLSAESLDPALKTFAAHLLALLGASPHPASLPIRLDSLTRQRSAEVLVSASSTLGSLFRVAANLSSISIPPAVLDSVQKTLTHLRYACDDLSQGRFKRALEMGRIAQEEAEKAFFERSMVAQVYFPDEHKVAVYLPLLGPVGVPLVMGLLREVVRWARARASQRNNP